MGNLRIATVVGLGLVLFGPRPALATFDTEVLSAVEPDKPLPDVHIGVTFDRRMKRARITREWIQDDGMTREARDVRELTYTETEQRLLFDLRVGLFRNLELHVRAPLILNDDSDIRFANGVDEMRSTVFGAGSPNANDPNTDYRFPITAVPGSRFRAGFGDMTFGLSWSPIDEDKDPSFPTLTLRADVQTPTGAVRDPKDQRAVLGSEGTGNVGRSAVTFDVSAAMSMRMGADAPYLDPYILVGARLPVAVGELRDQGYEPPWSARMRVGTAVVIAEDGLNEKYSVDLSLGLRFITRGRTYSELSDYLPDFNQTNVSGEVAYTDYSLPANYASQVVGAQCGIVPGVPCGELNQVDEHLAVSAALAVIIQPSKWIRFRVGVDAIYTTSHILTGEPVGEDRDPAGAGNAFVGRVNSENAAGEDERSPYHDPRYDAVGRRFRAEQILSLRPFVTAYVTF